MTDYLTLTEFVPGTKAKAQEVNANFSALKNAVNAKAALNGDNTQVFSVADATASQHAINKSQLEESSGELNLKIDGLLNRFCLVSGNVTTGDADLLSYSGTTLSFKIGSSYENAKWISANGTIEEITSLANITGLSTNGTYNVVKELGVTAAIATSSKVTQGKTFPTSPSDGDYHCLTATDLKTYKRVSGAWVETQYIVLGTVTVASSVISAVTTKPFNQNGYDFNTQTTKRYVTETYVNGTSWYTVYSDGWIEQGGVINAVYTGTTLTLLKNFSNTNYNGICNWRTRASDGGSPNCWFTPASVSTVTVGGGNSSATNVVWHAWGY